MRIKNLVCSGALTLALAVCALAAGDVNGKWVAEVPGRQGNPQEVTFNLKADGSNLTGTMSSRRGDVEIKDGKVDGDKVSFTTVMAMQGNEIKMKYAGVVSGDELKLTRTREGGDGQGPPAQEFTAKRAK
jgi:hypothetical protein